MKYASGIYGGIVAHRRHKPKAHRLAYRVFSLLLDLDELDELDAGLRLFAHNRIGLVSFHDRDHGAGTEDLRAHIETLLSGAGIDIEGGPIRLLCYPRLFGYAFNPLSTFFCYRPDGSIAAMIYQVDNTFGDRHSYLIPVRADGAETIHQACAKALHVSPFNSMDMEYRFRIAPPGTSVAIAIEACDADGIVLDALFSGRREELTDRNLARALLRYPLMTLKIIAGIHWEALKLWRKGVRIHRRPKPPALPVSVVNGTSEVRSPIDA